MLICVQVDNLKLVTSWDASKLNTPVTARVSGMAVQGATFDGHRLTAASNDAPTSSPIPGATFAWIPKDIPYPYMNFITVPLYVSADRSKLLAEVQMPIVSPDEKIQWTLSGLALFLGT